MVLGRIARPAAMAAMLFGLALGGVAAQEATPAGGPGLPPLPEGCMVVADGLLTPRYIAVAEDGTLYVTETGVGGEEPVIPDTAGTDELATPVTDDGATPAAEEAGPPSTRGNTGQVTVVSPDGTQSVLASGLPSYSDGVGPEGIVLLDGDVYVAVGGVAVEAGIEPLVGENSIYRIDTVSGAATIVAELGSYEVANNPDGTDVNANLYGLAVGADGQLYVADAGGNVIYRVDPATGAFALATVVPGLAPLTGATPPADQPDRQPVPTGLAVAEDGHLQVALLSEGWPPEAPSILHLEDDGSFTGVANGLSMVVGLAVGPDGAVYASQLWTGFGEQGPLPGNVLRINPDGTTEVVVDGLFLPHGIAFDAAGNLFVTTGALSLGPEPMGQVLRCEGVAGAGGATSAAAAGPRAG